MTPTRTARRASLRLLPILVLAVVAGCGGDYLPGAIGANDEVSVFTNTAAEGPVLAEVRRLYAYPVEVVGEEDAFRLDVVPFGRFNVHRHVKNQIFAVDLSRDDDLARALPGMLGKAGDEYLEAREPFLFIARDAFATGQTSLFAAAWSEDDLARVLARGDSTRMRREFEDAVVAGLVKTMFSLGEETDLPAATARQFGWTMRLQPNFFGAADAERRFVKFNAEDPVRLILVHWLDEPVETTPAAWTPIMARILEVYNEGDFVLEDRTRVFPVRFQGEPALKWEGVWQNDEYVIGGPFRAFAFRRGERSFVLVGQVFNPGQDKVFALRQVEAIMSTFRVVN